MKITKTTMMIWTLVIAASFSSAMADSTQEWEDCMDNCGRGDVCCQETCYGYPPNCQG